MYQSLTISSTGRKTAKLYVGVLTTAFVAGMSLSYLPSAIALPKVAPKVTAKAKDVASTGIEPGAKQFEELNPRDFESSENIDHPWWPLKPGSQWTFDGFVEEDGKKERHRIIFTVTDLVKTIGGVRSRVIFDTDIRDGKMIEQELTYFAQDKGGNVWHLGQYREVFESEFVGGRIWHVDNPVGSKAGIMMPADPKVGSLSFSQGYAPPPFNWTDRGRVYQMGQKVKIPSGVYNDVLVIEEFDSENPGSFQLKYYAKGVGNIKVGSRGVKKGSDEVLELVKTTQLDEKGLSEIRAKAFELEKRATMYPMQPPMEQVK